MREDRLSRRAISRLYNFPRSLVHPGHGRSSDRTSRPLNGHLKQFDSTTSSIELPQTSSKPNRTNSFALISINIDFKFVGETHVKLCLLEEIIESVIRRRVRDGEKGSVSCCRKWTLMGVEIRSRGGWLRNCVEITRGGKERGGEALSLAAPRHVAANLY